MDYSTPELQAYIAFAQEVMRRAYAEVEPEELNQWAIQQLAALSGTSKEDSVLPWVESFDLYEQILARRAERAAMPEDERKEFDWPWPSWGKLVDPLEPGMLGVVTAGDGMGKTIYAESLAEHWASRGHRVVFVHYERNRGVMLDRRAARNAGIQRRELKAGTLTGEQMAQIMDSRQRMTSWPGGITYVHTPGWTMERTVQSLRGLISEGLCDIVMVDYLEKCAPSQRQLKMYGSNHFQREADNVEQIKNFAEATETPVVMLAQMSKAGKQTNFGDLDRTKLRGAGEKTEKANLVAILHREKVDGDYSNVVNVMIDKNTLGATGVFNQMMIPERFKVADMAIERTELNT